MAGKGRNRRPCRNSLWPSQYEPFLDKQVFKIMLYDLNRFRTPILEKKRRTDNSFRLPKDIVSGGDELNSVGKTGVARDSEKSENAPKENNVL